MRAAADRHPVGAVTAESLTVAYALTNLTLGLFFTRIDACRLLAQASEGELISRPQHPEGGRGAAKHRPPKTRL